MLETDHPIRRVTLRRSHEVKETFGRAEHVVAEAGQAVATAEEKVTHPGRMTTTAPKPAAKTAPAAKTGPAHKAPAHKAPAKHAPHSDHVSGPRGFRPPMHPARTLTGRRAADRISAAVPGVGLCGTVDRVD